MYVLARFTAHHAVVGARKQRQVLGWPVRSRARPSSWAGRQDRLRRYGDDR